MKLRKTRQDKRDTYTYEFASEIDNNKSTEIKPGENGVTEANIKLLHALDDSGIYYELKSLRPERTEEEKDVIEKWKADFIERETAYRGYAPSDDEVKDVVNERFPRNFNQSLDYIFGDSEEDTDFDKSKLMYQVALQTQMEESYTTIRIRELMDEMTKEQSNALELTFFDGLTLKEAGKVMDISIKNVSKHRDNAMKYIEENFYK